MSGFVVNASWTRHHAISEIISIGKAIKREGRFGSYHEAKLRDGDTCILDGMDVDRLTNPVVVTMPAKDGFNVVHIGTDNGEDWVSREPVLAWQITALGEVIPVTIAGPQDNMMRHVPVEKPDGEIFDAENDATHKNLDAYREAQRCRGADATPAIQPEESA